MTAPTFQQRRRALSARVGALVLDSVLLAYGLWCVHYFTGGAGDGFGLLDRYPGLLLATPLAALLWQASVGSLGMLGYRVALIEADGSPASPARRAAWGLRAQLGYAALVLAPLGMLGWNEAGVATALALLLAAGGLVLLRSSGLAWPRGARLARPPGEQHGSEAAWYRRVNPWVVLVLLGLTFRVGGEITQIELGKLWDGIDRAKALWAQLFDPDWSIVDKVVGSMIETVFLALMASTLALPFAFLLSFLGARNLMQDSWGGRIAYALTRALMNVARSIEPLVWAIIFTIWVGVGPFAGMLALFVHSVAALGKLYSEAIESIDPGPVEAVRATGGNFVQVLRFGVVPQVVPPFLSFTVYRWDINVRMATILGLVGGGGIGALLINYQQMAVWPKVGTIMVFITLVVWILDLVSARARQRLN